ncbi:MAG: helix-turn-helix domain-containing protein [Brasilonema angustatum HA4187-MV1]|jgi:hypothetical protein|nr:helix-turn-helix domain-containing protein [Brasilonema angustatum HA4187-MV1]
MTNDKIEDRSHHPFVIIDLRILEIPLTTEAFRIYAELKKYANSEGKCFPSYTKLAKAFKGSFPEGHESTLKKKAIASVQELIEYGLLTKEERPYADTAAKVSNLYVLTPPSSWREKTEEISGLSHKKRPNQKKNEKKTRESALGSSESAPPQGSSESEPRGVESALGSSESAPPQGSSESEPRGVESRTLTRSIKLDPKEREGAALCAAPSLSSQENAKQQESQFTVTPSDQNLNNVNSNETTSTQEDKLPVPRRKAVTTSHNASAINNALLQPQELPPYRLSKEEFQPEFVKYWQEELAKSPEWREKRKEKPMQGDARRSLSRMHRNTPEELLGAWEAFLERKEKTEVAIATRERLVAEELPQIEALTPIDSTALKERLMQRAKNAKYRHLRNKN